MKGRATQLLIVELLVFLLVGLVLGFRPLTDPDIGWHVTTGLWILDHHTVPYPDPFSSGGGTWIAYSWLPDLVYGLVFRRYQFFGLQVLQLGTILLSMASLVFIVESSALALARRVQQQEQLPRSPAALETTLVLNARVVRFARALTYVLLIPTITLIWHLRPQALSIALFAVFIGLRERGLLRLRYLIPLTILWINVHIYWVFVPLILSVELLANLCRRSQHETVSKESGGLAENFTQLLLVGACVLVNPYGLEHLQVLYQYAFQHDNAYRLITEFQPIYRQDALIVSLYVIWIGFGLVGARWICVRRKWDSLCIGALFSVAAFFQLKYLVIFSIAVTPWVLEGISMSLQRYGFLGGRSAEDSDGCSALVVWTVVALSSVVGAAMVTRYRSTNQGVDAVLGEHQRAVIQLVEQVVRQPQELGVRRRPCVIFSDFNDSGWVILASYTSALSSGSNGSSEAKDARHCRVAIDGRTLVTGGERMNEYALLQTSAEQFRDITTKWQVSEMILPAECQLSRWAREELDAKVKLSEASMAWLSVGSAVAEAAES